MLVVVLDHAERRNALTVSMLGALDGVLADAAVSARALVLTGAGTHFCSGADLDEMQSDAAPRLSALSWRTMDALQHLPVPTVCALNGPAIAGGVEFALSCDLRVAAAGGYLLPRGLRWGAVTATRLARYLPLGLATEAIWLERKITVEAARTWGLVNEIVEAPAPVRDVAVALAQQLAELPGPALVRSRTLLRAQHETWKDLIAAQAAGAGEAWVEDRDGVLEALAEAKARRDRG